VDFLRYAEWAAALINAPLEDEDDLRALLEVRPWLAERVTSRDVAALRKLQRDLRPVFETAMVVHERPEEEKRVIERLNELMRRHPVSPFISGHDSTTWHLHVAERESSVSETIAAEGLMGMAIVVCDLGADRFGVCQATPCTNVFVDTSPNRSRRYCSERCSSRANVAAFRARRRAARVEVGVGSGLREAGH
jgi:predicted RNA-binding Zn ribbon-like protein